MTTDSESAALKAQLPELVESLKNTESAADAAYKAAGCRIRQADDAEDRPARRGSVCECRPAAPVQHVDAVPQSLPKWLP